MKAIILPFCFLAALCPAQVSTPTASYQEKLQEKCSPELLRFMTRVAAVIYNPNIPDEHRTERLKYVPTDELPESYQHYFAELLQVMEQYPNQREAEKALLELSIKYPEAAEDIGSLQLIVRRVMVQHQLQEEMANIFARFAKEAQDAGVKAIDEESDLMRSHQHKAKEQVAALILSCIEPALFFDSYHKKGKVKIELKLNNDGKKGSRPLIARPAQSKEMHWIEVEASPALLTQLKQKVQVATGSLLLEVEAHEAMREEGVLPSKAPISSTAPHEKHLLVIEKLIE